MLLIQLPVPEGVLPRYWHSTIAVDLAPGFTEVTVFAGCPHLDPKRTLADQVKLAETVILSFGMFVLTIVSLLSPLTKINKPLVYTVCVYCKSRHAREEEC